MSKYASDKPDLRFGLEMSDVTDIALKTDFRVFHRVAEDGGAIKGFVAPGLGHYSNSMLKELENLVRDRGAKGLSHVRVSGRSPDDLTEEDLQFSQGLRMGPDLVRALVERMGGGPGDLFLLLAGPTREIDPPLSALRSEIADRLELVDPDTLSFAFVVDFPLFEWNPQAGRWDSSHHPFTAPKDQDLEALKAAVLRPPDLQNGTLGELKSKAYDLVCNGSELASGSIRVHRRELQEQIFQGPGLLRRRGAGQVRPPVGSVRIRRASPRRNSARYRQAGGHPIRRPVHTGCHCFPQDSERRRPAVRGALRRRSGTAEGPGAEAPGGIGPRRQKMTSGSRVTVRVPATTANLGPGFDCLGMALDLWSEVTVESRPGPGRGDTRLRIGRACRRRVEPGVRGVPEGLQGQER